MQNEQQEEMPNLYEITLILTDIEGNEHLKSSYLGTITLCRKFVSNTMLFITNLLELNHLKIEIDFNKAVEDETKNTERDLFREGLGLHK